MSKEVNMELLKQQILNKGFTYADIEYDPDDNSFYVRVWFYFKWTQREQDKLNNGWHEFEGNSEEEILNEIDDFISTHKDGEWIIVVKDK